MGNYHGDEDMELVTTGVRSGRKNDDVGSETAILTSE